MKIKSVLILVCLVFFTASSAFAGNMDISAREDAQVADAQPDTNFGTKTNFYIASAGSGSFGNERGWLKFDLEGRIPPGAAIVSATLRLYCFGADDEQDMVVNVHGSLDDTWTETGITWNSQPAFQATVLDQAQLSANKKGYWVKFDVTSFVSSQQTGDRMVSFVAKPSVEGNDPWETYQFDTLEYTGSLAPRLRIEYSGEWTPEAGFKIFHINDAHSRMLSHEMDIPGHDDISVFEKVGGAAYMAAKMIELKQNNPNSLILDAGDISEGNPVGDLRANGGMIDFYNLLDSKLKALNGGSRGIDAVVVGNHDVRRGEMITNMLNADFPFISMNLYHTSGESAGTRVFPAWVTVDVNGRKVGVLGYTNDSSSYLGEGTEGVVEVKKCVWTDDDSTTINIQDMVEELRNIQGCDVVILLSHIGQSRVVCGDDALLEASGPVAPPEVVISGHWHSITDTVWQPAQLDHRTLIAEAASYMQYIGELEVDGRGRYVQAQKHVIKNSEITPDGAVTVLINDLITEYNNGSPAHALDEVIGYSAVNLSMDKDKWWTLNEYPWSATNAAGAWITDAMKWKALALGFSCDLAIQSGGGIRRDIPAGWITYAQIYEAYPWEDDNMVMVTMSGQEIWDALESLNCGASISYEWEVYADDGEITQINYNGEALDLEQDYQVAVSEYMALHEDEFSGTTPVAAGYSIRESVIDYTGGFDEQNPLTIGGLRYHLNTEFAGGFQAVVTMLADAEKEPYYEAAFIRLLNATETTLLRRGSYGLSDLVKSDGSINTENQLSEIMLYRSHLGLRDGVLKPGDIIEIWGEGGFYAGNPQFVDQQGIVAADTEMNIVGYDADLAAPEYYQAINAFMDEWHENHLVKFHAVKVDDSTVEDAEGTQLTVYQPGGYYTEVLPGSTGDVLELTGVNTMRYEERRLRLRSAVPAADLSVTGFPPSSKVDAIETFRQTGTPLTLTATAQDSPTPLIAGTSFEEALTGDDYVDTGDAGTDHALVNNTGQMSVNYASTGSELGFASYYTNTLGSTGLTDGDAVGVTEENSLIGGSFEDGSKAFLLSDTDGMVTVTLDTVNLAGQPAPQVSISLFIPDTAWEGDEIIRVFVTVDGGTQISLLDTTGQDIDDMGIEGSWQDLTLDLSGYTQASLSFELQCNAGSERVYVDNVRFENGGGTSWTDPAQVEFFYRYAQDDVSWGAWTSIGTLSASPWQMSFEYPEGVGYYEFASVATDTDGNVEEMPVRADAKVHYAGSSNTAPDAISNSSVPDGSVDVNTSPVLSITVSDPEYDLVNVYFYNSEGNLIQVIYGVASGQSASVIWAGLGQGMSYGWYVVVDDGVNATRFPTMYFTTQGGQAGAVPVPTAGLAGWILGLFFLLGIGMMALKKDGIESG